MGDTTVKEEACINDTLQNMINNLKPQLKTELNSFSFDTPGKHKRANSSGMFDFVTPPKKVKLNSSVDYIASPRETRRMRADLLEARNNILSLENRIQHMHNVRKEMQLMFDNELAGLKQQRKFDQKNVEELETQLQNIRKRESELKTQYSEAKNKLDMFKLTTDRRIEELEKNLVDLKDELSVQSEESSDELINLKQRVEELENILEAAQEDAEAHRKLSSELESRLTEREDVNKTLEIKDQALQKARLDLKELEYLRENYQEYQQQIKTHFHKLSTYSDLEKENQRLKDENKRLSDGIKNKLILEEEVHDLKSRLLKYKENEKTLAALQTSQVQMEQYLNEWKAVARGVCESTGSDSTLPHLLRAVVERLQHQEISLTSDKVQLESQLNTAIHDAKVARSELEKNTKLITDLQASVQQRQTLIHRMQKKLLLVSRERDSYRSQLDSYERDLTMCMTSTNAAQASTQQTQKERIENLERVVEGYREMVTKLETELQNLEPNVNIENLPIRVEQINRLQQEVDKLKFENDHLRQQREQLEIRLEGILIGSDTKDERIVHLAKNPLAESVEERDNLVENLKEEVLRLKRKISNLEEGLEASKLNDTCISSKDVQNLKEQLKSSENQIQRLKEYFKSSMQEFRDVVYMLLGYKIDKTPNSEYKLTSMYAEHRDDQLWFQLNSNGAMNLLANEFSSTLEEVIDLHLRHQKSIPVFLSAITMNLFSNKTLPTKTYEIEDDDDDDDDNNVGDDNNDDDDGDDDDEEEDDDDDDDDDDE